MIHLTWKQADTVKQVQCIHTNAAKYLVHNALTEGKVYDVKNETEEFYFVVDNKGEISGFYKTYFKEI